MKEVDSSYLTSMKNLRETKSTIFMKIKFISKKEMKSINSKVKSSISMKGNTTLCMS